MFPYVSKEFNVRMTGEGLRLPPLPDLENAFSEQFLIGFTTRTEFSDTIPQSTLGKLDARKNMLSMERFGFTRCGITQCHIKFGEVSIFDDGPLKWGSKASTPEEKMIEAHAYRKLFEMQKDFWGRPGNPLRHKGNPLCV